MLAKFSIARPATKFFVSVSVGDAATVTVEGGGVYALHGGGVGVPVGANIANAAISIEEVQAGPCDSELGLVEVLLGED